MSRPDLDIIKSPEGERMREMVTEGFYDRSRIGLWLFEVIGREWDGMAEWARTLRKEAFPQTCTWSIPIWEFVYGYEPDDSLTLEYRRGRILSHRLTAPPINPARIEAALSALTGYPVSITDPVAPYTFRVEIDESGGGGASGNIYDFQAALKLLRKIKPSHLSFKFETRIVEEYEVENYDGGAISELWKEFYSEEVGIVTDAGSWDAGTAEDLIFEDFTEEASRILTDIMDYSANAEAVLVREFHAEQTAIAEAAAIYDSGATNERTWEYISETTPIETTGGEAATAGAVHENVREVYTENA